MHNNASAKKAQYLFTLTLGPYNGGGRRCFWNNYLYILAANISGYYIILSSRRALNQTRARNTLYKHNNTLHMI